MSSNLAVINFAVGGTLTISGKTTLGEELSSTNIASFQGLNTTTLSVSQASTFNSSLPTSTQTPTIDSQLTTKVYVDNQDTVLNTRITDLEIYTDNTIDSTNDLIYETDGAQKTYIDEQNTILDTRITDTDALQRIYIDEQNTILDTRITDTDALQKIYIDTYKANDILQMKVFNPRSKSSGGFTNLFATGTEYTILFQTLFVSKSNNSTIQVVFDAEWGINGSTVDSWKSSIFINGNIITTKVAGFKQDNRQSSIILFPISGAITNDVKGKNIPITVQACAVQSGSFDSLTIYTYNVMIYEIQN